MGIFSKKSIKENLFSESKTISNNIKNIFSSQKLTQTQLDELGDLLVSYDVGIKFTSQIINSIAKIKFNKNISSKEIKQFLADNFQLLLEKSEKKLNINSSKKPYIIIFNGVNGAGKTTTIGKIAHLLKSEQKEVMIASCDSFRAGANEQLKIWSERVGCKIIECKNEGEDPSAIAYRAVKQAENANIDVLLVDTAGRLQNKKNLMEELTKINRVVKKASGFDPDENILIIDSRNGQNIINQITDFDKYIKITGLIMTKLDGTARGGILLTIAYKFLLPIYAISIGENIEDLREFNAKEFAYKLLL